MSNDRQIEMTPENIIRMFQIAELADVFRDPVRQRWLVSAVLARAVSNEEVFEIVKKAATVDTSKEEAASAAYHADDQ